MFRFVFSNVIRAADTLITSSSSSFFPFSLGLLLGLETNFSALRAEKLPPEGLDLLRDRLLTSPLAA